VVSAAREWYAEHDLPYPPVPSGFDDQLDAVTDTAWATPDHSEQWWETREEAEQAALSYPVPCVVIGAGGRGMAGNALYCTIVTETAAVFFEHGFGNVGDPVDLAAEIDADYELAGRILSAARARPPARPFVVYKSTLRLGASIWLAGERSDHRTFEVLPRALDLVSGGDGASG
jgi:hypothetical protein